MITDQAVSQSLEALLGAFDASAEPPVPAYAITLSDQPAIELVWHNMNGNSENVSLSTYSRLDEIRLNTGILAVCGPTSRPTPAGIKCLVVASTGLSNGEIGDVLHVSEDTVKTHLKRGYDRYGISERSNIARVFMQKNIFRAIQKYEGLELSPNELSVVDCLASGMRIAETGETLQLSPDTVKTHIARMTKRNNIYGQEQLCMAALMSGQIQAKD